MTVFKTKGNGTKPPFRVFNCTNNSLRNTKIQHIKWFVVVVLVLLIFCTLNLTCSRRSDISRDYGAKRRGEKKTKQNKTNKKKKERKEKKRKKKLPYLHPRCFFPYSLFFALAPLCGCLEQASQNDHSI